MKRITGIITVLLFSVAFVNAQQAENKTVESPQARAKSIVAKMSHAVGIKGEQISKVNSLYTEYYTKKDAIKGDLKMKEKDKENKLKELKKDRDKKLKAILTADQLKKWEQFKKDDKKNKE